jgi:hypothetical protein
MRPASVWVTPAEAATLGMSLDLLIWYSFIKLLRLTDKIIRFTNTLAPNQFQVELILLL